MRHFLFEDKEYQMRPSFKQRRIQEDSARDLARLFRRKGTSFSGGGGARKAVDVRQKCVVKVNYSNNMKGHNLQINYLSREGTDIDGGSAKLFGTDIDEYKRNMVDKNFRVFLSPQSPDAGMRALAEKFVRRLELQTGFRLYWQGACHYNTAHPHAHLLINGVDKDGKDVTLPRDVVKTFMREAARNICTEQLGTRSRAEIALEKERELSAPRFTRLDEQIKRSCDGTFRPVVPGTLTTRAKEEKRRVLARLERLRSLKLCVYKNGEYELKSGWEESLITNGRYNCFLKARDALRYSPSSALKVYTGEEGEVAGRVTKVFRAGSSTSDSHAVLVEALNGRAYFVPLFKAPAAKVWQDGAFVSAPLAEGALVNLKAYKNQKGRLTPDISLKEPWQLKKNLAGNASKLAQEITGEIAAAKGRKKASDRKNT